MGEGGNAAAIARAEAEEVQLREDLGSAIQTLTDKVRAHWGLGEQGVGGTGPTRPCFA